ncbi:early nodulin-like protein 7 [Perilla frutescens var. frutescens]|nr:early nodulin-like protein 7 [Perilla frutescens var. frutescens]
MAFFTFKSFFFAATMAAAAAVLVSGFQFEVGGKTGWRKPTGKEPETYNEWAAANRFHIGDAIHFMYKNDSVMSVSAADYLNCNGSDPVAKFEDGNTVFEFDRPGFFYFISGHLRHCMAGQKLIIRVMHPLEAELAPSPSAGSDDWASPAVNSTTKLAAFSFYITAFAGLFTVLYFLV